MQLLVPQRPPLGRRGRFRRRALVDPLYLILSLSLSFSISLSTPLFPLPGQVWSRSLATGEETLGKLHLVDLAGSERVKESKVEGSALRETLSINKSLSALSEVALVHCLHCGEGFYAADLASCCAGGGCAATPWTQRMRPLLLFIMFVRL